MGVARDISRAQWNAVGKNPLLKEGRVGIEITAILDPNTRLQVMESSENRHRQTLFQDN